MNRRIIALGCLLSLTPSAHSQSFDTSPSRNLLSLSIGPSFPAGPFSSTNASDNSSGYAKTGEAVNLSFIHEIHNGFGLTALLLGQRNPLNTGALTRQLDGTGFEVNGSSRHYPNWTADKTSWFTGSLLVGITKKILLGPDSRFSVAARALVGAAHVQSPKISANSKSDTSYAILTQNSGSAFAFSYLTGVGLFYHLRKHLSLLFGADYFATTSASFKNSTATFATTTGGLNVPGVYSLSNSSQPIWAVTSTNTVKQPLGSINLHLGASFAF